jgi:hypothetical protein
MFQEREDQPGYERHQMMQVHIRLLEQQDHLLPYRDQRAFALLCPTDLKSILDHSQDGPNLH